MDVGAARILLASITSVEKMNLTMMKHSYPFMRKQWKDQGKSSNGKEKLNEQAPNDRSHVSYVSKVFVSITSHKNILDDE